MGSRDDGEKWTGRARIHETRPTQRAKRDLLRAKHLLEDAGRAILQNRLKEAKELLDEAERLMERRC